MRYLLVILLSMCFFLAHAQKEDHIWYLGKDQSLEPGYQTMEVNFNKGPFDIQIRETPVGFHHNNHAICDEHGELLFYTNGCAIVNREQEIMPNGHRMNWDSLFTAALGWNEDCRLGYPGLQDMVILKDPGYDKGYYIIHKAGYLDEHFDSRRELRMTYIDLALEDGKGDVVFVDSVFQERKVIGACLTAIPHDNGQDWWILQPITDSDKIATFLVTENGVIEKMEQTTEMYFSYLLSSAVAKSRFSPDGTSYAYFTPRENLHIYDFDRITGLLSNYKQVDILEPSNNPYDGKFGCLEWSPDSRFIYLSSLDSLFQVDTWDEDIQADGIRLIDVYNGTLDPFATNFFIMALAPDCRIYMCSTNGSDSYHVINNPNGLGADCDFVQNGIRLPQHAGSANIPLHPRWRVDEDEKCDSTITSIFGDAIYWRRDLTAYPNPVSDILYVESPDSKQGDLYIMDMNGGMIKNVQDVHSDMHEINLSGLPAGMYNVEYVPKDNNKRLIYTRQVVKN